MLKLLSRLSLLAVILVAGYPALAQSSGTMTKPDSKSGSTMTSPTTGTANDESAVSLPERLKLSSEQKKKIKASVDSMRQKISAELTPEQRKKFEIAANNKSKTSIVLSSLNLTPAQTNKVFTVVKNINAEILSVLTPEQMRELQAAQAERKNQASMSNGTMKK